MSFSTFLVSINKISVLAFLITVCLLVYEIYLLNKERKIKVTRIPAFDEKRISSNKLITDFIEQDKLVTKSNSFFILILIIFFIVFGVTSLLGFANLNTTAQKKQMASTPQVSFIYAKGIKIFDQNWKELTENELKNLKRNSKIIIALDKTADLSIDMARIKVNKVKWQQDDATIDFKKELNIFYKEYQIGTSESALKIDAQLHSKTDGWLGD